MEAAAVPESPTTALAPVAIITASGRGIGAACARELAKHGWRLALLSPLGAAEALASELGGLGVTGSVTSPEDLERLADQTMDTYGRIDGVVNSTGSPPGGPLLAITDDDWQKAFDLIILNIVRIARLVTPVMERQRSGAFVKISSFAAFEPDPAFPTSSTLRAALGSYAKL
jgi:NAD(P)-dependent dehydrogenase (short-subunit alcohol dehydrogenase family)